eukprot:COSAG06_NODE_67308_length_252_cov_0.679739_1_plen_27_part_10
MCQNNTARNGSGLYADNYFVTVEVLDE